MEQPCFSMFFSGNVLSLLSSSIKVTAPSKGHTIILVWHWKKLSCERIQKSKAMLNVWTLKTPKWNARSNEELFIDLTLSIYIYPEMCPAILVLCVKQQFCTCKHFFDVHYTTTGWNLLLWRFVEDVNILRWIFLNWAVPERRDKVWNDTNYFFQRRFHSLLNYVDSSKWSFD